MEIKRQRANKQSKVQEPRSKEVRSSESYALRFTPYVLRTLWTLDFGLWTSFALLCLLLAPMSASAQVTSGGAMISLYGVVQVEPGPDVATLEVKGEMIRFAIQNVQCADRGFSTGGFMTDVTRKDPGLHLKGSEEWLEMLIEEPPSKRTLQMTGVYYKDSRMFVLNKLARFNKSPGLQQ